MFAEADDYNEQETSMKPSRQATEKRKEVHCEPMSHLSVTPSAQHSAAIRAKKKSH
jgi:hypothetical protein